MEIKRDHWILATLAAFSAYCLGLLFWVTAGFDHFNYTLDDPYIHLKLARNLAEGHYGFNLGEYSSPSSSIFWPFLLAPFSKVSFFELVPYGLNFLIGLACVYLIFNLLAQKNFSKIASCILSLTVVFMINLPGLMFNGLEHVLQVTMVVAIVGYIMKDFPHGVNSRVFPATCLMAFALTIRYEMLVFWAAFSAYFFLKKYWKKWALFSVGSLIPLVCFSIFLKSLGLGALPASVMAKTASDDGMVAGIVHQFLYQSSLPQGMYLLVLMILAIILLVRNGNFSWANLMLIIAPTMAHLAVGKFGWFFRYEVYIFTYLILLIIIQIPKHIFSSWRIFPFVVVAIVAFGTYIGSVSKLAPAAMNIKDQQEVTSDFIEKYLPNEAVGLNDIGLIGLRHGPYILDLWGLASSEALALRLDGKNTSWITYLSEKNHVEALFVYTSWLQPGPDWFLIAEFKLLSKNIVLGGDVVSMFARKNRVQELSQKILEFKQTLQNPNVEVSINTAM